MQIFHILSKGWMAFVFKCGENEDRDKMGHLFWALSMLILNQGTHYFDLRTKRVSPSIMGEILSPAFVVVEQPYDEGNREQYWSFCWWS